MIIVYYSMKVRKWAMLAVSTNLAVRIAYNLGTTLVGGVVEEKMNVYTNNWSIVRDQEQRN